MAARMAWAAMTSIVVGVGVKIACSGPAAPAGTIMVGGGVLLLAAAMLAADAARRRISFAAVARQVLFGH